MDLVTPYDVLAAYSQAKISSDDAIASLGLDGFRDLLIAMGDAGHQIPRPTEADIEAQLGFALPLLLSVLGDGRGDA